MQVQMPWPLKLRTGSQENFNRIQYFRQKLVSFEAWTHIRCGTFRDHASPWTLTFLLPVMWIMTLSSRVWERSKWQILGQSFGTWCLITDGYFFPETGPSQGLSESVTLEPYYLSMPYAPWCFCRPSRLGWVLKGIPLEYPRCITHLGLPNNKIP